MPVLLSYNNFERKRATRKGKLLLITHAGHCSLRWASRHPCDSRAPSYYFCTFIFRVWNEAQRDQRFSQSYTGNQQGETGRVLGWLSCCALLQMLSASPLRKLCSFLSLGTHRGDGQHKNNLSKPPVDYCMAA